MRSIAAMAIAALSVSPSTTSAAEAQTAAPPAVQQEIQYFLAMIGRSHQCAKPSKPRVLSSEISEGAIIESGQLVSGKIMEVWVSRMCGSKIKYLFTISPDASGQLKLNGFEPLR